MRKNGLHSLEVEPVRISTERPELEIDSDEM
jgi:hypothetical protein